MKLKYLPACVAAFAATIWTTGKCIHGMTWLLMKLGCDVGHAQAKAPLYTGILLGFIAVTAFWGWVCTEKKRRIQRCKYIDRRHARVEELEYRQNRRDA